MKKEELKSAFNKEFKNIEVSEELKAKTLKAINESQPPKISHIPYLRNFAAVFVVSLICLSIYLTKNPEIFEKSTKPDIQESTSNVVTDTNENLEGTPVVLFDSSEIQNKSTESYSENSKNSRQRSIPEDSKIVTRMSNDFTESLQLEDTAPQTLQSSNSMAPIASFMVASPMTEEDFLSNHPEAKKTEDGYIIHENDEEVLYTFVDGLLESVVTLN